MKRLHRETKKRHSLQWSMIKMLVLCWLFPLVLLAFLMLFFLSTKLSGQAKDTVLASADKAVEICLLQIKEAREASRNASYLPTIRERYYEYKKSGNKREFYNDVTLFLAQQYQYNENFLSTMLIFLEDKNTVYYTYSNMNKATYTSVKEFKRSGLRRVLEKASKIDTNTEFMNIEGHLYMIRNLVEPNFNPYAVIVMEINKSSLFESLNSIFGQERSEVYLDGDPLLGYPMERKLSNSELMTRTEHSIYTKRDLKEFVYAVHKLEQHHIAFVTELDSKAMVLELDAVEYMGILVLVFMIPLVGLVFNFFHKKVSLPIKSLVEGANRITKKEYGYQVNIENQGDEFDYLSHIFNEMSLELQYQFEQIYLEELALRDAKIEALQSQINPHFLNNTLEIINWEARLGGNERVSGMIEALSTMLNATMNRRNQHLISLKEELQYVDAYLYIIKQRFQEKFQIIKNIEEKLLVYEVPRLIIQPIMENAMEHGISHLREGRIVLSIYEEQDGIIVEIEDSGTLTKEDEKKIENLLHGKEDMREETSLNLGIRNVHQRLKILYGEGYGLTIKNNEQFHTVSRLRIGKNGRCHNIIQ